MLWDAAAWGGSGGVLWAGSLPAHAGHMRLGHPSPTARRTRLLSFSSRTLNATRWDQSMRRRQVRAAPIAQRVSRQGAGQDRKGRVDA